MPHLRLSARAQSDLTRLRTFLAQKDINAAKRALLVIREAFMPLVHAPMIGRPVENRIPRNEVSLSFCPASGHVRLKPTLRMIRCTRTR